MLFVVLKHSFLPPTSCFLQVLSCILDPLLQLCTVSASNLGTADMASYMVNSLYVMKTTLALFEFTDKRLEMLEFQVGPRIATAKRKKKIIRKTNDIFVCVFFLLESNSLSKGR